MSIWYRASALPQYPPLSGDVQADAVIIGGGLTGLLTARLLQDQGVEPLVLEAGRIAGGQTGRTTAKITSQHGLIYTRLLRQMGREPASQYARANEEAVAAYERLITQRGISCDFVRRTAFLYSREESAPLQMEADAARSLGIDASFRRETELPFPIAGAVAFAGQAQFHPLRFLQGIVPGLKVCENTRVLRVGGNRVETAAGTVTARHIIFACHYPFVNLPGLYFMRMHQERSYVLALESPWLPREGMYLGVDGDGLSLREAEGLLLLGGGAHRTGENREGGRYTWLRDQAAALLPGSREAGCWSAQDCITADGLPCIGQYARNRPDWYVATGFGKWGMTSAMISARVLTGMICGDPPAWAGVFSPQRFHPSASAKGLADEAGHALRGLSREVFSPPRAALEALPPGHGGIVEAEGRKVGAYRAEDGTVHLIDPRCPHLGCQLEWNPDERTWDCPCHGSRFSYDGQLLDGPAQTDKQKEELHGGSSPG